MLQKRGLAIAYGVLTFALALTPLFAQQPASISGTVTDQTGAVIAGAQVTLVDTGTGEQRSAVTSTAGFYSIPSVETGTYDITVRANGFRASSQHGLRVNVGQALGLNFHLQVGASNQTITVAAAAAHLQTNSATVSDVIGGSQIQSIAVNGRNFNQLALLVPGASTPPNTGYSGISHLSVNSLSFNGMRAASNMWMIDGVNDSIPGSKGSLDVSPALDAIAQFQVATSNYTADVGQAGGAAISVRLKSGTNQFHGTGYEFLRNDAMDARQALPYSPHKVPLKLNDFGFTVGGPVVRKKLFFFYSGEWRRLRQGTTFVGHTPTALELNGDFSQSPLTGAALKNPTGNPSCVSGAQIAPSCFNQNAVALLKSGAFPTPNAPGFNNYATAPSLPSNYHQELGRFDYSINDKWKLMAHFIHEGATSIPVTTQWGGSDFPTVSDTFDTPSLSVAVRLTELISPTLLNVVHFGATDASDTGTPVGAYRRPADYTTPTVFGNNPENRIPELSFTNGYTGVDEGYWPYSLHSPIYTISDEFTKTLKTQTLSLGGLYQRGATNQPNQCRTQGAFSFNGQFTGNPLADFLLGYPIGYTECNAEVVGQWRYNQFEAFIQDQLQLTPHLTWNIGVRYFLIPHAYASNGVTTWLPQLWNAQDAPTLDSKGNVSCTPSYSLYPQPAPCNMYNGLLFAGTPNAVGVGKTMSHTYYRAFAPRLGLSWRMPSWLHNTVLRAGYGMSYYRQQMNDSFNILGNPPIVQNIAYANSPSSPEPLLDNPAAGATPPVSPSGLFVIAANYKMPQYQQFSAGIQHLFGDHSVLSVMYVGSLGTHLRRQINYNLPRPTTIAGVAYDFNPALNANSPENLYRPFTGFSNITMNYNDANSAYNSLQVNFERQMARGLRFQAVYTYGRAFDNSTANNRCNLDRRSCWGQTNPHTQMLVANYIYDLPFFHNQRGFLAETFGGWRWSGITSIASGSPFSVGITGAHTGLNVYPDVTGAPTYPKTVAKWFNTDIFASPAPGHYGNEGFNEFYGPHYIDWDMNFSKGFEIAERVFPRFEIDFFNIFNNVNLEEPDRTFGDPTLGEITSSGSPRILQAGVHVRF